MDIPGNTTAKKYPAVTIGFSEKTKKWTSFYSYHPENMCSSNTGIVTFKKSKELADTVASIPLKNLMVETDSPYLSPEPYRGKPNEPSYIIHTIKKISELKNVSEQEIIKSTTDNFNQLFNLN